MTVTIEFFGIPRERAATHETTASGATLGDVLRDVARQFPAFGKACLNGDRLHDGYLANINGRQFTRDSAMQLADGDRVLILSADAGG